MVASWQGEIDRLDFGIEQEQFIFRRDGRPPSVADCVGIFEALLRHGYTEGARDARGQLITVERQTPQGVVVVKNDFASHIFELSYPPFQRVEPFAALYRESDALMRAVLAEFGIAIHPWATLDGPPEALVMRPSDTDLKMRRYATLMDRPQPAGPFSHMTFFGAMCSTQVHLNVLDDAFFARLPAAYSVEYLVPLLFPNGPRFNGRLAHSARPLMYRDGFRPAYRAYAIPRPIPTSAAAYAEFLAGARHFVRDYTFLAPSRHGTVEYRTGDSQRTPDDILDLLALRVALTVGVARDYWTPREDVERHFWAACLAGSAPPHWLETDYRTLQRTRADLPDDYRPYLDRVLWRLEEFALEQAG